MRRRKTCSNAQDWWNRTPGRVTLPPSAVSSPASQAQPEPAGRTDQTPSPLSPRPHRSSLLSLPLSLSPRPRDAAGTERDPPPRLAGDGWLRQLGRHRLEPNRGTLILPFHGPCSRSLARPARPPPLARPSPPPLRCVPARTPAPSCASRSAGKAGLGLAIRCGWGHGADATAAQRTAPLHAWACGSSAVRARAGSRLVLSIPY